MASLFQGGSSLATRGRIRVGQVGDAIRQHRERVGTTARVLRECCRVIVCLLVFLYFFPSFISYSFLSKPLGGVTRPVDCVGWRWCRALGRFDGSDVVGSIFRVQKLEIGWQVDHSQRHHVGLGVPQSSCGKLETATRASGVWKLGALTHLHRVTGTASRLPCHSPQARGNVSYLDSDSAIVRAQCALVMNFSVGLSADGRTCCGVFIIVLQQQASRFHECACAGDVIKVLGPYFHMDLLLLE